MSPTQPQNTGLRARYESTRGKAAAAIQSGELERALELFSTSHGLAAEIGDEALLDRSFCNLAATEIELGRSEDRSIHTLRQILGKNQDLENCRLAAYHLARLYDLRMEFKKALFYARVCRERSDRTERRDWIASSRNQMGSLLLAESRFGEAQEELEGALALVPDHDTLLHAFLLDNLGYAYLVQKRMEAGFRCLFKGLRMIRRLGARHWEGELHLTLCYGYLELGRWQRAARHGVAALKRSEEAQNPNAIKNALFLLGEVASLSGDDERAYDFFSQLQERFYPEQAFLPNFLLAVDVSGLVNLKA